MAAFLCVTILGLALGTPTTAGAEEALANLQIPQNMPPWPGLQPCSNKYCWGINQGWGSPEPPYAGDLHGTPLNLFIEKLGAGLGTNDFHLPVTENQNVGGQGIIELGVATVPNVPTNKFVYWYLQGPGYYDHCDANGGKTPYQIWARDIGVENEENVKLWGEKQADAFMDRYLLPYHDDASGKDYILSDYFQGNTVFVDFEQPIPVNGQTPVQVANCIWGAIGSGWSLDPGNPDHTEALVNQYRRNKIVLSGFLARLRLRLDAAAQKGLIPPKNIGIYTRTNLFNSTDRLLPSNYRFPEKMVLWLAEYPGGTTCMVPDEKSGAMVSIHPLETDPTANVVSIAFSAKTVTGYGVFHKDGRHDILGLQPVIWQYCNDNDVAIQDPSKGFSPLVNSSFVAETPSFAVQLSCEWIRPAAANGTCVVDSSGCKVTGHITSRADCRELTPPEMLMKVSCTGRDCAKSVSYVVSSYGTFQYSTTYPDPSLIPAHNLYMTSHGFDVNPFNQNLLGTVLIGELLSFSKVQDVPGDWQSSSSPNWLWVGTGTGGMCSTIVSYQYDVTYTGFVSGCPVVPAAPIGPKPTIGPYK
jgi:hypothetical protein